MSKAMHINIVVKPNESIDQALSRFNRKIRKWKFMDEINEHQFYEKPSVKRKKRKKKIFIE
jgi:small subunit ribosomal protein S21